MARLDRCLTVALLGLAGLARAQNPETEHRLKSAGVDPDLRQAVHQAIAKGVKYLRGVQRPSGGFHPSPDGPGSDPQAAGWTALCGLALRHAGLPDGVSAARRSLAHLIPDGQRPQPELQRHVYSASLVALLAETESQDKVVAWLGDALVRGQTSAGWWTYGTSPEGFGDLSNSQFAVLALSASRRTGVSVDARVWRRHLDTLLRTQQPDGSWSYGGPVPWSYPTGTFMGLANLVQAAEHIDESAASELARRHGLRAMSRDVRATLDAFDQGWLRDYYALYAMERACIFLGLERVGGRSWYVDGARALVRIQEEDGGWSGRDYVYWTTTPPDKPPQPNAYRPSMEATAFALLFLVRAPEHERVTTPRPIDVTITRPGDAAPQPALAKEPQPATPPIPVALAVQLLAVLEAQLGDKNARADQVESSLIAVVDAAGRVDGPAPEVAAWRDRAAKTLLRGFLYRRRLPAEMEASRRVNLLAARALGGADAAVSARFIESIERYIADPPAKDPDEEILAEAFSSLARLGRPESFLWLRDRMAKFTGTDESAARVAAALDAMTEFSDVSERVRYESFVILLRSCPRGRTGAQAQATSLTGAESVLEAAHIRALQWLATDPATSLPPRRGMPTCGWIVKLADFEKWFRSHKDPKRAPWKPADDRRGGNVDEAR